MSVIRALVCLGVLVGALSTLRAVKREETPFTTKNVKRLKGIAILLMIMEPFEVLAEWIVSFLASPAQVSIPMPTGYILAAGLVVYCVSLVFAYGVPLQKQMDEML